ncbi:MAG TPA: hypothetical protein VHV51_04485, partial [Polyangiaceae bacterium]|nr:hypothetical protein [Polyangiaceae bacterium]
GMITLAFAGCGGSNTTNSNPIPLDQIPAELAKSFCAAEQACNPFFYAVAFENTDCVTQFTKQFQEASYNDIQVAVTGGTTKYDGNLARTCADAIGAGSCSVLDNNTPDSCQQALSGTVATGGDCSIDQECQGLARCDTSAGTCPGKCAPRASAGVACGNDSDCDLGLVCSPATSRCVAPAAEGAQCKGTVAGNCSAGLICVGNDDANKKPGTCMTAAETLAKHAGETCDLQNGPWCASGLSCVVQSLDAGGMLTSQCQSVASAGAQCGIGIPSDCPAGQYCPIDLPELVAKTYTANCSALPLENEACGPAIALQRCAANLVCDTTTTPAKPICVTPHELGDTCSDSSLCYSQNCVSGACAPASPCAK